MELEVVVASRSLVEKLKKDFFEVKIKLSNRGDDVAEECGSTGNNVDAGGFQRDHQCYQALDSKKDEGEEQFR